MREEHHCDLCMYFDTEKEYCRKYQEAHAPGDGEHCRGWRYWEEMDTAGRIRGED